MDIHRRMIHLYASCVDIGDTIMWTKPAATEHRIGFEVTCYVMYR